MADLTIAFESSRFSVTMLHVSAISKNAVAQTSVKIVIVLLQFNRQKENTDQDTDVSSQ